MTAERNANVMGVYFLLKKLARQYAPEDETLRADLWQEMVLAIIKYYHTWQPDRGPFAPWAAFRAKAAARRFLSRQLTVTDRGPRSLWGDETQAVIPTAPGSSCFDEEVDCWGKSGRIGVELSRECKKMLGVQKN